MTDTANEFRLIGRLLRYLAPLAPAISLSALLRVLTQGSGIALLSLAAYGVGRAASGGALDPLRFGALLAAVGVLKAATRYGEQLSGHFVAFSILSRMRSDAFDRMETLAPAFPEREKSGEIVSRLTADIDRIEVFYAHTLGPIAAALVLGAASVAAASALSGPAAAAILAGALAFIGLAAPFALYLASRGVGMESRRLRARMAAFVAECVRGAEELFVLGAEDRRAAELERIGAALIAAQRRAARLSGLKDAACDAAAGACLLGTAYALFASGAEPAAAFAVLGLCAASVAPALSVGRAFDDLPETAAAAARFFELLDAEPAARFPEPGSPLPPASCPGIAVSFRGVAFAYPGAELVLKGIDLEIPAGARCLILGPSGGGKSTLLRLAARYRDPDAGDILLDGVPARGLGEKTLRSAVALLSQDAFLFDLSVGENLRLTSPRAGSERTRSVLDALSFFPGSLDRLDRGVGPRGSRLSGGERKRLAAARALLSPARLLLLDESFSNLDAGTRASVRSAVLAAASGRTVIEVSHEEADAAGADMVVRVEGGRAAAERGDELTRAAAIGNVSSR